MNPDDFQRQYRITRLLNGKHASYASPTARDKGARKWAEHDQDDVLLERWDSTLPSGIPGIKGRWVPDGMVERVSS